MRTNDHGTTEALHYTTANRNAWNLLIKCLRTGAVHELRMVFVDAEPQILPMFEDLYHVPTAYRSLSRREAGVIRLIARGMSNKSIAKHSDLSNAA